MLSDFKFDTPALYEALEAMTHEALDALEFGVVRMSGDGIVTGYNTAEAALSGLSKERVLGRHFFSDVAPCTNNFMVAQRFEGEAEIDAVIDYVFTLRMRPRAVRLRLMKRAGASSMYLVVASR